jgi:hypothetical protein
MQCGSELRQPRPPTALRFPPHDEIERLLLLAHLSR